jgi:hypothetical protein
MEIELPNKAAFNDYAARFGWDYDNGGLYRGLVWDWYASEAHCWGRNSDGTAQQAVVVMRREHTVAAVHFHFGVQSTEIWCGDIRMKVEFDRLVAIIASYMTKRGRIASGAPT